MRYSDTAKSQVSILKCDGDLNASSAVKMKNRVARLLNQNQRRMILDLGAARRINIAALGILIERLQKVRSMRGDIRVINLRPQVSELFEHMGVNHVIESYPNAQEAIRSYRIAA